MKLKTYFAPSVEEAVGQARRELGDEALLMNSRRAGPEARHLGAYEVVFAVTDDPAPAAAHTEAGGTPWEKLIQEVAGLRRQVERTATAFGRAAALSSGSLTKQPELAEVFSTLVAAEVPAEVAEAVVERLERRRTAAGAKAGLPDAGALREAAAQELSAMFSVDSTLGREGCARRVVAVVGPPGAGKTSLLVKLAFAHGLTARRPAHILSLDVRRVAAAEQLRTYAAILGIGFQALETTGALAQALEEHSHKDLVLIDTPGLGPAELDDSLDLALFLSTHPEVDTLLVLSATTKTADLSRAVERFEMFRPRKLAFTRLDETAQLGGILGEAIRTEKPLAYFSGGQQVPEDLEAATKERLLGRIWPGGLTEAAQAA